jgi:hypothetical protein
LQSKPTFVSSADALITEYTLPFCDFVQSWRFTRRPGLKSGIRPSVLRNGTPPSHNTQGSNWPAARLGSPGKGSFELPASHDVVSRAGYKEVFFLSSRHETDSLMPSIVSHSAFFAAQPFCLQSAVPIFCSLGPTGCNTYNLLKGRDLPELRSRACRRDKSWEPPSKELLLDCC